MTSKQENGNRLSLVIEMMRFPLIVMVLYIHAISATRVPIEYNFSAKNIFILLSETLSHNIFSIAVPCFFLFSGFFFFFKLKDTPKANWYKEQGLRRSKTILIPYIIWNLALVIAIIIKNGIFQIIGLGYDSGIDYIKSTSWSTIMWNDPINFPLWYLRDLICMTLLAPLFYIWLRFTRYIGIILLFIFYLSPLEINIPGFSSTAIFYYGLGAYMGIYKVDILSFCNKRKQWYYLLAAFLLIIAICTNGREGHILVEKLFIPFGIICFFNIINRFVDNTKVRNFLCRMSPTVFFIYAIHEVYIYNWVNGFFVNNLNTYAAIGGILTYTLKPIIVLVISLMVYYITKKQTPQLLNFMIGGRLTSK